MYMGKGEGTHELTRWQIEKTSTNIMVEGAISLYNFFSVAKRKRKRKVTNSFTALRYS